MRAFFLKSGHFFRFPKKGRGGLPHYPLTAYLWVWLNMHQYPWISLNILENIWITVLPMPGLWICLITLHVWQAFENASGSKCARVLNMPQLNVQELHRVPNMSGNSSICHNNAWICLNMAEYCWMSLHMPENAWINCFDNACVLYASSS